jgi:hypothetical protein
MTGADSYKLPLSDAIKHQFFDFLMLIGLRDRLRCPKCKAIGTWKPHGGWCDRIYDWWTSNRALAAAFAAGAKYATDRRWVCKYCGHVRCWEGELQAYPHSKTLVWAKRDEHSLPTPKEAVEANCGKAWPWRG